MTAIVVTFKSCGCGVLVGEACDCVGPTPAVLFPAEPAVQHFRNVRGRLVLLEEAPRW